MTNVILTTQQIENLRTIKLEEELSSSLVAFGYTGNVYTNANEKYLKVLEKVFGKDTTFIFSYDLMHEGVFTQPISFAELVLACQHGLEGDIVKVNHKVYFDGGYTVYQMSLNDYRGWKEVLDECNCHNSTVADLWYRVKPEIFRAKAEVRRGRWARKTTNLQAVVVFGGIALAVTFLPAVLTVGIGGIILGSIMAKRSLRNKDRK